MTNYSIYNTTWQSDEQVLMSVRCSVFVEEQGVPMELEHDVFDETAVHLLAKLTSSDTPIATARLLPDGHVGRMAVMPDWRKQGIGSSMLKTLITHAKDNGIPKLFLHAQCTAVAFYQKHGFMPYGEIFDDAGIPHQAMSLLVKKD